MPLQDQPHMYVSTYHLHLQLYYTNFYSNTEGYIQPPTCVNKWALISTIMSMQSHMHTPTPSYQEDADVTKQTPLIASYAPTAINAILLPFENFKAAHRGFWR